MDRKYKWYVWYAGSESGMSAVDSGMEQSANNNEHEYFKNKRAAKAALRNYLNQIISEYRDCLKNLQKI